MASLRAWTKGWKKIRAQNSTLHGHIFCMNAWILAETIAFCIERSEYIDVARTTGYELYFPHFTPAGMETSRQAHLSTFEKHGIRRIAKSLCEK